MITCKHLGKSFNGAEVLKDISFRINRGEKVSLIGPGGSGKTTIIKCLLGIIKKDRGDTLIDDVDLNQVTEQKRQNILKKVGMAFQQGGLFDFMTVRQNIMFAMENMTDFDAEKKSEKIKTLLQTVKLPHVEEMFPHELSGGMQRRIGIARALCTEPTIAFFDEPTSGLDPVTSTIILNMISELGKHNKDSTLLTITSNVEIAIRFANRIIVLDKGKIVADDDWRTLILSGPEWVQNFLSVRLIGLSLDYVKGLGLPDTFIERHWRL